jgi:sulfite reductase (ferredoxin)
MYTIPDTYKEELRNYREQVHKAAVNETDPVVFKIIRVLYGIYEQRQRGLYMLRIRCAGGMINPAQLAQVSKIAGRYGSSFLHITTRQELQLHNLDLTHTPDILDELYKIGLTTKGSGGNTVRNITASIESGIDPGKVFDVSPYCVALTGFLISKPEAFDMPRKFKIAFSCSEKDSALASFSDLGFIAKWQEGQKGFKVFIGGAPSVKPMTGHVLFDFLPAGKIFGVTLAVIEMFNRRGNRKNRHQARLRYVFYKYGKEKVFAYFNEKYDAHKCIEYDTEPVFSVASEFRCILNPEKVSGADFEVWKKRYTNAQVQPGRYTVQIPVLHGNLTVDHAYQLAVFATNFGEDTLRFSRRQNIHLRNIPEEYLGNLYSLLIHTGFDIHKPFLLGNLVSCTGADTCQLGICLSKSGLQAVHDELAKMDGLDDLSSLTINISGCPNSCGQHLVSDLGFSGKVSRNGYMYPAYAVYGGAVVGEMNSVLPDKLGEIAARDMPRFTIDLLQLFAEKNGGRSFRDFIKDEPEMIKTLFMKYRDIPAYDTDKSYYMDWGNNELFNLETRGSGECSAGLPDRIEFELKSIEKYREVLAGQEGNEEQTVFLCALILAAGKLLCFTRQKQFLQDQEYFTELLSGFIGKQFFDARYTSLIVAASEGNFAKILRLKDQVIEFSHAAVQYYQDLDESLQPISTIQELTVKELKNMLDTKADFGFIDVREPWEKEIADIGGDLIPLGSIEQHVNAIPTGKLTVIYCRTGRRSAEAIHVLMTNYGYSNLRSLKGGIHAWADQIDQTICRYQV